MITEKVSKQDCVGCKACKEICPVHAIVFEIDNEGFWYPKVDRVSCVRCGGCIHVCPALKKHYAAKDIRKEPNVYKAYHKEKKIRYRSTSGGLYYALAKSLLDQGGYIVGCVYKEDFSSAYHYASNSEEGLKRIMCSKYFQSDTEGIFEKVRGLLVSGQKVLFCGTPCQISALYGFLRKEYENLYTVDFICRGINSPLAYSKYIEELKDKYHSQIEEVHFKDKSHGWTNLGTRVQFQNGKKYYKNKYYDPWVNGFITGNLYMRPCCAVCKYKGFPRISDISMGDFWGLSFSAEEEKLGVSVVLVNTEKGDALFQMAGEVLYVEERSLLEAVEGNPALVYPVQSNPARKEFFERIQKEPYSTVVWDIIGSSRMKRICYSLKADIKHIGKIAMQRWKKGC